MEDTPMLDLTGVSLPFTVTDMVTAGMSLLGLVATFVLLRLAFTFVPRMVSMIVSAVAGGKKS